MNGLIALGLIWFVLLLIPSSMLVLLDLGEPMAEHRVYLAAAGLFLAVGAGLGWAWAFIDKRTARSRLLLRCLIAMWLTLLGGMTVLRNEVWSSTVGLWLEAVDRSPQVWVPHLLLGEALHERGASEQALAEYRMAVRLRPDEPTPYMKVGLTLAELHRFDEAAAAFQELENKTGGSAMARNGLGAVALLAGRPDEARRHYQSALTVDPKDVASRQSLALIAETIDHDPAAAIKWCQASAAGSRRRRQATMTASAETRPLSQEPPSRPTDGAGPRPVTRASDTASVWGLVWTLVRTDFKARYHGTPDRVPLGAAQADGDVRGAGWRSSR